MILNFLSFLFSFYSVYDIDISFFVVDRNKVSFFLILIENFRTTLSLKTK